MLAFSLMLFLSVKDSCLEENKKDHCILSFGELYCQMSSCCNKWGLYDFSKLLIVVYRGPPIVCTQCFDDGSITVKTYVLCIVVCYAPLVSAG